MTNEELTEMLYNTWTFTRTDSEGITTSRTFRSETWFFALQQFVNFLKQDFGVDNESVAINASKYSCASETDIGWYGDLFYPEGIAELPTTETQSDDGFDGDK